MIVFTGTYIPYEYKDKHDVFEYIKCRCHNLKKALRLIEKDTEHLTIRCPVSGDYVDILGSKEELDWLDNELKRRQLYRTT